MRCAPSEDSNPRRLISLRGSSEDALDSLLPTECSAQTLIRLSLRWVHMRSYRKCCVPAHTLFALILGHYMSSFAFLLKLPFLCSDDVILKQTGRMTSKTVPDQAAIDPHLLCLLKQFGPISVHCSKTNILAATLEMSLPYMCSQ